MKRRTLLLIMLSTIGTSIYEGFQHKERSKSLESIAGGGGNGSLSVDWTAPKPIVQGDLLWTTGSGTCERLPVGKEGQILIAKPNKTYD